MSRENPLHNPNQVYDPTERLAHEQLLVHLSEHLLSDASNWLSEQKAHALRIRDTGAVNLLNVLGEDFALARLTSVEICLLSRICNNELVNSSHIALWQAIVNHYRTVEANKVIKELPTPPVSFVGSPSGILQLSMEAGSIPIGMVLEKDEKTDWYISNSKLPPQELVSLTTIGARQQYSRDALLAYLWKESANSAPLHPLLVQARAADGQSGSQLAKKQRPPYMYDGEDAHLFT